MEAISPNHCLNIKYSVYRWKAVRNTFTRTEEFVEWMKKINDVPRQTILYDLRTAPQQWSELWRVFIWKLTVRDSCDFRRKIHFRKWKISRGRLFLFVKNKIPSHTIGTNKSECRNERVHCHSGTLLFVFFFFCDFSWENTNEWTRTKIIRTPVVVIPTAVTRKLLDFAETYTAYCDHLLSNGAHKCTIWSWN